jgi:hypothetical protein
VEEGGEPARHAAGLALVAALLERFPRASAQFVYEHERAELVFDLRAPGLIPARAEAGR